MTFGFIVLRHVNSCSTNKYWNQCVKLLRLYYPSNQIVIIDDNSDYTFIKAEFEYKNIQVVQSEYPKRGELLPYVYYLRHKWFDSALVIHDSTFIHSRIPFDTYKNPVLPLWHFEYDKENLPNIFRIASHLHHNYALVQKLKSNISVLGMTPSITGCFGVQSFIHHSFLVRLNKTFNIASLLTAITCRTDRCSLERVMAAMFHTEHPRLYATKSLLGNIFTHYKSFMYNFDEYEHDFKQNRIRGRIVKVWTGR